MIDNADHHDLGWKRLGWIIQSGLARAGSFLQDQNGIARSRLNRIDRDQGSALGETREGLDVQELTPRKGIELRARNHSGQDLSQYHR